jgi:hypothetical protein
MEMTYFNWYNPTRYRYSRQPNNLENKCMVVDPSLNYQWSDAHCNAAYSYICMSGQSICIFRVIPRMSKPFRTFGCSRDGSYPP